MLIFTRACVKYLVNLTMISILFQAVNQLGDANEVLNERAVIVMARMSNKLTGRDFTPGSSVPNIYIQEHSSLIPGDTREADHGLSVKVQVQKLILQATSHENLCQNYVGYVFRLYNLPFPQSTCSILHLFICATDNFSGFRWCPFWWVGRSQLAYAPRPECKR